MSDWISAEDKLPDKDGRYLVFVDGVVCVSHFFSGVPERHFYECWATHWMQLPKPPEVKDE